MPPASPPTAPTTPPLDAPYLSALLDGDRHRAFAAADDALAQSGDLAHVYLEVLEPALWEVGRLWERNELTVAEEHLATAITQAAMARLFERVYASSSHAVHALDQAPTLLAACAADERHQIGLRMVCDLLELDGWRTVFLGASVPVESLAAMVARTRPSIVALSAAIAPHLTQLQSAIAAIRAITASPGETPPLIIVGGRGFRGEPGLGMRIGADLFAPDARAAVDVLGAHRQR